MFSGFFGTQHFFQGTARVLGCLVSMCVTCYCMFCETWLLCQEEQGAHRQKLPWDTCLLLHEVI